MSRKWWAALIGVAVVVGLFVAIKMLPLWATLLAAGSYAFGYLSGYLLKKEKIVEVIKQVEKKVVVPVEKIVEVIKYVPAETEPEAAVVPVEEEAPVEVKKPKKRRNSNKKVAE